MATYVHGKKAAVVHGGLNLQPWMNEATASLTAETGDTSHMGHDAKTYIMGQNDATFSGAGLYDGSLDAIQDHFEGIIAAETSGETTIPITFTPEGLSAIGNVAVMSVAKTTSYEVNPVISDVVSMTFEMQANGGMRIGNLHFLPTAITTTTAAASIDNVSPITTPGGAIVYAHILSNANTGNVTVTLQHSTNNSTWVDLITLPVVTTGTLTAYRVGESTGTVNRYLRVNVTLAGTGAVSVVAAAVRK